MNLYLLLCGLTVLTLFGAALGIRLAEVRTFSQRVLPFSGGLLIGIALFWILPEIASHFGWPLGSAGLMAGFGLLWLVDHFLYPVCPSCAHTHDHGTCDLKLHGFAAPLLIASGLHSFFDGWSLAVSQEKEFQTVKVAFLTGISVHKLPEGLVLGVILLAALGSPKRAMLGAAAAQSMMLVGGGMGQVLAPHLGTTWTAGFLAVAAGAFVYLGYHAIDAEYQRRGIATAMMPALTGAVGAAALRYLGAG